MKLLQCGHAPSEHGEHTTGYGVDSGGRKWCYACCAARDKRRMTQTGRATLYLVDSQASVGRAFTVQNWSGSLCFPVTYCRKGAHNMARTRYDVWFTGPDGKPWYGVQYGDNTQILHCRRVK
jgi:hypothetical protein